MPTNHHALVMHSSSIIRACGRILLLLLLLVLLLVLRFPGLSSMWYSSVFCYKRAALAKGVVPFFPSSFFIYGLRRRNCLAPVGSVRK